MLRKGFESCLGKNSKLLFLWTYKFHFLRCLFIHMMDIYSFFSPSHITFPLWNLPWLPQVTVITLCAVSAWVSRFALIIPHYHSLIGLWPWLDGMYPEGRHYTIFLSWVFSMCHSEYSIEKFPIPIEFFIVSCKPYAY